MRRRLLIASCIACSLTAIALGEPSPATWPASTQAAAEVVRGDGYAIRLPAGWRDDPSLRRGQPNALLAATDGRSLVDEVGEPLHVGATVERSAIGVAWLTRAVEVHARKAETSAPQLKLLGQATTRPITLADGTPAVLLVTQFNRQPQRHRLEMKLFVAKASDGSGWLITGHIEAAGRSKLPAPTGAAAKWLAANVLSFVFDADKQDLSPLPPAPAFAERRETPPPVRRSGKKGLP